ncbi:MAG: TolC family protein [Pseudomonadota bacterium]
MRRESPAIERNDRRTGAGSRGVPAARRPIAMLAACCLAGLSGASGATEEMTLDEVMGYAIEHAPGLAIARQGVIVSDALLQQASGAFDSVFDVSVTAAHEQGPLIPAGRRQQEGNRRLFEMIEAEFTEIADDLERQLEEDPGSAGVDCGDGNIIIIDGENVCEDDATRQNRAFIADITEVLLGQDLDPERREALEQFQLNNISNNEQAIEGVIADFRLQAQAARNSRDRLGGVPPVEVENSFLLDVGYQLNWRNGQTLRPQFLLEGVDDIFRNKEREGALGGKNEPQTFRSAAGLTWTVPLGRGGGISAAAAERSADRTLAARQLQARFTAALLARDITIAYWRLAASQERIRLQREQVQRQQELVRLSAALAKANQSPAADVKLAQASRQQAAAALILTRTLQRNLRLDLSLLMGLPVELEEEAPLAIGNLPAVPSDTCTLDEEQLVPLALGRRADLAALDRLREAQEELLAAADYDLRPRIDFTMTVAYSTLEEGGPFVRGLRRAAFGDFVGPSLFLGLSGELPTRNDLALGTYRQRVATTSQAETRWLEAHRSIGTAVVDASAALLQLADQAEWRRQSITAFDQMLQADRLRLRDSRATVIDVLVAQEQLHASRLAELATREAYWIAVAVLRHEIDSLLIVDPMTGRAVGLQGATTPPCAELDAPRPTPGAAGDQESQHALTMRYGHGR